MRKAEMIVISAILAYAGGIGVRSGECRKNQELMIGGLLFLIDGYVGAMSRKLKNYNNYQVICENKIF